MTIDATELTASVKRAASSVVIQWPDVIEADDLEEELLVWYLERPSVRGKFDAVSPAERHKLLVNHGHVIATERHKANKRFYQEFYYSVDDVKAVLLRENTTRMATDDLNDALVRLQARAPQYAAAIVRRYTDGITAKTQREKDQQKNGLVALTEEMNKVVDDNRDRFKELPGHTLGGGPGYRKAVSNITAQYELRRQGGGG